MQLDLRGIEMPEKKEPNRLFLKLTDWEHPEFLVECMEKVREENTDMVLAGVHIKRQHPAGKSYWAYLVRNKVLQPKDVVWAFIPAHDGIPASWIAVRLDTGNENGKFFLVCKEEGRKALKEVEEQFRRYLNNRRSK